METVMEASNALQELAQNDAFHARRIRKMESMKSGTYCWFKKAMTVI